MNGKLRLLALALGAVVMSNVALADDDENISYVELPENAKAFIEKHFGNNPATKEVEYKDVSGVYTVELRNGYDLKFNSKGAILEIDSPDRSDIKSTIAKDVLPSKIITYLTDKSLLNNIDEIKILRNGDYMVEIDKIMNSRKLRFDKDGQLVKQRR